MPSCAESLRGFLVSLPDGEVIQMSALVMYDSVFGNTEKIARAIADALGPHGSVEMLRAGEITPARLTGLDLLVVGSPTRGFRPTEAVANTLKGLRGRPQDSGAERDRSASATH